MYICICNAITDGEIRSLVSQGCRSVAGVYRRMGCRPQCCKCSPDIRRLINDEGEPAAEAAAALNAA